VQLGLADPAFTGGRLCYRFEESVHRFQNMVVDRMLGLRRVPAGDDVPQRPMFG
jgi:choline monooxygenase